MSKVKVRVSGSLKGELTIAPLNFVLKKNNIIYVSSDEFLTNNVQLAVQKGILLVEELPNDIKERMKTSLVKIANVSKTNLSLTKSGLSIKSGDSLIVHKNLLKQRDIIESIGSGVIETVELDEVQVVSALKEEVKVIPKDPNKNQKTLSEIKKSPVDQVMISADSNIEDLFLEVQKESIKQEPETKMSSWNPKGEMLSKEKSAEAVMKQQNAFIPKSIAEEEKESVDEPSVDFVDMSEEEIIDMQEEKLKEELEEDGIVMVDLNEDEKKREESKKKAAKKKSKKKITKARRKSSKKKTAKEEPKEEPVKKEAKKELDEAFVEPNSVPDVDFVDDPDGLDEISFVDEEQDQERIPSKKTRIADMNEEIS